VVVEAEQFSARERLSEESRSGARERKGKL